MTQLVNSSRNFTISATDTYHMGDGSNAVVSTFSIQLVPTAFVGSITVKARSRLQEAADAGVPFVAIPYEKLWLNGAVGDGSLVSAAITADSLILVPASGLEIELDATVTSGKMDVYVVPLQGAAA